MNEVQIATSGAVELGAAARRRCREFVQRILRRRHLDGWEVSVLFCDDPCVRALNRKYRGADRPTDVLSFAQWEGEQPAVPAGSERSGASGAPPALAGDVVVSLDTLRRNAGSRGIAESEELKRLLIHGILHLEGLDHGEGADGVEGGAESEEPMIELQERILRELKRGTLL